MMSQCVCRQAAVRPVIGSVRRSAPTSTAPMRLAPLRAAATDAAPTTQIRMSIVDGVFVDPRWVDGTWDLAQFPGKDGKVDWDGVIDAEIERRRILEDTPVPSIDGANVFDTSVIPWYVWVRRFHLPEAEKLNGRAAMMGYVLALFVDQLTGAGLLDQQESFLGKLALHATVFGILLIRSSSDIDKFKNLIDEATFYDKQWNATWEGKPRPSESNKN